MVKSINGKGRLQLGKDEGNRQWKQLFQRMAKCLDLLLMFCFSVVVLILFVPEAQQSSSLTERSEYKRSSRPWDRKPGHWGSCGSGDPGSRVMLWEMQNAETKTMGTQWGARTGKEGRICSQEGKTPRDKRESHVSRRKLPPVKQVEVKQKAGPGSRFQQGPLAGWTGVP